MMKSRKKEKRKAEAQGDNRTKEDIDPSEIEDNMATGRTHRTVEFSTTVESEEEDSDQDEQSQPEQEEAGIRVDPEKFSNL